MNGPVEDVTTPQLDAILILMTNQSVYPTFIDDKPEVHSSPTV